MIYVSKFPMFQMFHFFETKQKNGNFFFVDRGKKKQDLSIYGRRENEEKLHLLMVR